MLVYILVTDGAFDTGLSAVMDSLSLANELAPQIDEAPPFEVQLVASRVNVSTDHGLRIPVQRAKDFPDLVIVPAVGCKTPELLTGLLARKDIRDTCDYLSRCRDNKVRLAAACTGTYLLAASGALVGQSATTSWWLAADFRERFAEVALDESRMVIESGNCVTAGAALAHVDLALWLIRQVSTELARLVARFLLVDSRPSQVLYAMHDYLQHADEVVDRFERWARSNLANFSVVDAAKAIGTTERTLQRRLYKAMGVSPIAYVQKLRIEQAVHCLQTTQDSVDRIAEIVGYQDGVTLRTLLRKKTGRGVREIRSGS